MSTMRRCLAASSFVFGFAACSSTQYAFVPATARTSSLYDHAAADYPIPAAAPHGDLRVASYGFEVLSSAEAPDQRLGALHLRIFVSNNSALPWSFDTRDQRLAIDAHGTSTAAFATASPDPSGTMPPIVRIAPSGSRLIDLFFPLPSDVHGVSDLPAFQLSAKVQTDAGVVTETTPFRRVETDRRSAYAYDYSAAQRPEYNPDAYGYDYWDAPFWYDPGYVGFHGGVFFPAVFRRGSVYGRGAGWGDPGYYHSMQDPMYHGGGGHGVDGHGGGSDR